MKRVQADGYNKTITIVDVSADYWECSVCGVWHPPESYCDPVELKRMQETFGWEGKRTRTNCHNCYELSAVKEAIQAFEINTKAWRDTNRYRINELYNKIKDENAFNSSSMSVAELIEKLKKYPPDMRIALEISDNEYGEDFYTEIGIRSDYVGDEEVIIMGDRI